MYLYKWKKKQLQNGTDETVITPRHMDANVDNANVNNATTMLLFGSFGDENSNWKVPKINPGPERLEMIMRSPKWRNVAKKILPHFSEKDEHIKCKLTPIDLFRNCDCFFLNNANGKCLCPPHCRIRVQLTKKILHRHHE